MNKIQALEAYKVSIILKGVTNLQKSLYNLLFVVVDEREAWLLGQTEEQYGRGDGWNDVGGDNEGHGRAEVDRVEVREADYRARWT